MIRKTVIFLFVLFCSQESLNAQPLSFERFLGKLIEEPNVRLKSIMIDEYLAQHSLPLMEGNTVYFLYRGKGKIVQMAGDFNSWEPKTTTMVRLPQTDLYLHIEDIPRGGRMEYKFIVDEQWILDPFNKRKAPGEFGENSEVWSKEYQSPTDIEPLQQIPHGTVDTMYIESKILNRRIPVFVYTPFAISKEQRLPTLYITDGGEYMSIGKMTTVLDNLLSQQRIKPVLGVFIDPRTNLNDQRTNHRREDYTANDSFLDFIEHELAQKIERNYPATHSAKDRFIMGASLGGLISTYMVMLRSHFVKNCAAQSPAYNQANKAIMKLFEQIITLDVNVYMDTGTINDTQIEARAVSVLLQEKGAKMNYSEYPEGHNWSNWRARVDDILVYFFSY
ncbi:MAG: hypothetical protein HYZ34_08850 [Ignavibacteriae bacterium]|nr:hypothetical protein [Ignavibacteriota bacterium]